MAHKLDYRDYETCVQGALTMPGTFGTTLAMLAIANRVDALIKVLEDK